MSNETPGNGSKPLPVFTLLHGIEGKEPLCGTAPQLMRALDGYPFTVVHEVLWIEARGRTALYRAIKSYYVGRMMRYFEGKDQAFATRL